MPAQGTYAKGVARRAEILDTALDVIARNGYTGATLREIAGAVGLSQNGVLHYFGSKEQLLAEVLHRRDAAAGEEVRADDAARAPEDRARHLLDSLPRVLARNAAVPGLVTLYARLSADATETSHPAHEHFAERYTRTAEIYTEHFARMRESGVLAAHAAPELVARMVIALCDGLQMQWLYDQGLDVGEVIEHFAALVAGPAPDPATDPAPDSATAPPQ